MIAKRLNKEKTIADKLTRRFSERIYYRDFINNFLSRTLNNDTIYRLTQSMRSLKTVILENTGDTPVTSLKVKSNCEGFYDITGIEREHSTKSFNNIIIVGDIIPSETVKINIWSNCLIYDDVLLIYDGGTYTPKKVIKSSGFFSYIGQFIGAFAGYIVVFTICLMAILQVLYLYAIKRESN